MSQKMLTAPENRFSLPRFSRCLAIFLLVSSLMFFKNIWVENCEFDLIVAVVEKDLTTFPSNYFPFLDIPFELATPFVQHRLGVNYPR
jgi:hypothetical protein